MSTALPLFALLGLGPGALIAGIAVALVASHRGAGVINLASGATAMVSGYAFWSLTQGYFGITVPIVAALPVALLAAVVVGVVTEWVALRPLRTASPLAKMAASLGVLLTLQATVVLVFGTRPQAEPSILPAETVTLLGVIVPVDRFLLAGIVVAVTAAVAGAYRWSRFGLATRAAAENEEAALLAGLSTDQLSMVNTILACGVAGLLGVLAAPIVQVDSTVLPLQVVPALAAALFARFTSLWIACAAGLGLGVLQSVVYYLSTQSWFPTDNGNALPGVQQMLVFVVIVVALFLRGAALPGRGAVAEARLPSVPVPHGLFRQALLTCGAAAAALVVLPYDFRQALTNSVIGMVIVLSSIVITGYVGQISVMQLALSGTAGFLLSHLALGGHLPFPLDAAVAVLAATALGVVAGVAALRVRGVGLAVVTLAAAMAMEQGLFFNTGVGGAGGVSVPSPRLFGVDLGPDAGFRGLDRSQPSPVFGWLALAVAAALGVYVANLRRTQLGRAMLAVRSNERAAAAAGISVRGVKIAGITISSLIAAVAGALYGYNFASVSAARFTAMGALALVGFAYMGGISMVSGAVIAGLWSTEGFFPHALERWVGLKGTWALLVGGVSLVVTLVTNPDGIAGANHRRKQAKKVARTARAPRPPGPAATDGVAQDLRATPVAAVVGEEASR
ncbi:MAG TPA: ABC transporter permease [Kineosporiaceae bacterium]